MGRLLWLVVGLVVRFRFRVWMCVSDMLDVLIVVVCVSFGMLMIMVVVVGVS